ncbi:MAG: oligosaccharide flippase family protein, partial [Gemmatimonadales bacterium]
MTPDNHARLPTLDPPPESDAEDIRQSLDRSLIHGVAWTGGLKWITQIASWASTIVVARLLTPADYGLFGMATLYLGLVQLVNEFGLGAAIIRQRDLTEEQISDLTGVSWALGFVLMGISVGMAWPVAAFFKEEAVRLILIVLSVTFVLSTAKSIPRSLMSRDLQFRRVAIVDATEVLVGLATTLTLAILGYR